MLPWFGRGKTTVRGGYSISYSSIGNFTSYREALYDQPGTTYVQTYTGQDYCLDPNVLDCYMDFSNIGNLLPLDMGITGLFPVGHPDRQVNNQFPPGALTIYEYRTSTNDLTRNLKGEAK